MLARLEHAADPIATTEAEAAMARIAADLLNSVAKANRDITVRVESAEDIAVPLPAKAVQFMMTMLTAMAEGHALSVIPHQAELSTKQAADFLHVSRPFVCKLIDEGKLPARMVNRHRRVKFADLMAFEAKSKGQRLDALAEMAREARELGLE